MSCMRSNPFWAGVATLLALLAACSPEQNWRQVALDNTSMQAQLPCKPDRTVREVPLAGSPVSLSVAGCESGDAMLVVMTGALPAGADAQAVLQGWRQASLAHLQADTGPGDAHAWQPKGWLPLSSALQQTATGRRADGRPVMAHLAWGAVAEGDHVRVVHAAVYAPRSRPELAQGLFDGLKP